MSKHRSYHTVSTRPGQHLSHWDQLAETTADELDVMIERLDELEDWATDQGYRALECKISEARGPLSSAAEAMRQYATGELRPT